MLAALFCRNFPDGFPNLFVKDALEIRNKHVAYLASFHNPSVIFEQLSVIYALPRLFVSSFTLVLPFFPTGTYRDEYHCTYPHLTENDDPYAFPYAFPYAHQHD